MSHPRTSLRWVCALTMAAMVGTPATTLAAAEPTVCGRAANADPAVLLPALRDGDKLPEVFRDKSYVALQDKATWAMWTFTVDGNPAHPAVICRIPLRQGAEITLDMVITCKGEQTACAKMEQEFKALNAMMEAEIRGKQPQ
ncbi:MAG: hypothetical protein NW217_12810 [Hyphomicrobiaceae bacterium]|nr:hypothetical protein [Hyphomicrobiaceae bacterium]